MVQFNLLPDIKLEYIKARRMKRLVVGAALVVSGLALAIFVLLFLGVNVVQRQHLSNLDQDINSNIAELQSTPDINKVLTIQNQLNSLTALHVQKPSASRFIDYLTQTTPENVTIAQADIDFTTGTITTSGQTDSLKSVNKYVDTLKFTTFTTNENTEPQPAFSQVVLTGFGVSEEIATYQISFKFNPEIFNNTKEVTLKVPEIVSTRSATEKPSNLFKELPSGVETPTTQGEEISPTPTEGTGTESIEPTTPVEGGTN